MYNLPLFTGVEADESKPDSEETLMYRRSPTFPESDSLELPKVSFLPSFWKSSSTW